MINYSTDLIIDTLYHIKNHSFFEQKTMIWQQRHLEIETICRQLMDKILVKDPYWLQEINHFFVSLKQTYSQEILQYQYFLDEFPTVFFSPLTLQKLRNIGYFKNLQGAEDCTAFELTSIKEQQMLLPLDRHTDFSKLNFFDTNIDTSTLGKHSWFLKPAEFKYCFNNWQKLPNLKIFFESMSNEEILENLQHLDDNFCYHYTIDNYQDIKRLKSQETNSYKKLYLNFIFVDQNDVVFSKLQTQFV